MTPESLAAVDAIAEREAEGDHATARLMFASLILQHPEWALRQIRVVVGVILARAQDQAEGMDRYIDHGRGYAAKAEIVDLDTFTDWSLAPEAMASFNTINPVVNCEACGGDLVDGPGCEVCGDRYAEEEAS